MPKNPHHDLALPDGGSSTRWHDPERPKNAPPPPPRTLPQSGTPSTWHDAEKPARKGR